MGTRSLTIVKENDQEICIMYRSFDGYISEHGHDLAKLLKQKKVINGIPPGVDENKIANGMGCLAAQLIAHFKPNVGGIYILPPNTRDCGEEYIYEVTSEIDSYPNVKVYAYGELIFSGTAEELCDFEENYDDD